MIIFVLFSDFFTLNPVTFLVVIEVLKTLVFISDMKAIRTTGFEVNAGSWLIGYLWTPGYLILRSLKCDHKKSYVMIGILLNLLEIIGYAFLKKITAA